MLCQFASAIEALQQAEQSHGSNQGGKVGVEAPVETFNIHSGASTPGCDSKSEQPQGLVEEGNAMGIDQKAQGD